MLRSLSQSDQSRHRDRPENRSVDNLSAAILRIISLSSGLGCLHHWSGIHHCKEEKERLLGSIHLHPLASDLGKGDSSAEYDYTSARHLVWQIECDAPSKSTQATCAPWTDSTVSSPSATPERRLRLPGTAYPAYSYVQYQDVAPYFQIASQYGYANYFSRPIRVQFSRAPVHHWSTSQAGNGLEPACSLPRSREVRQRVSLSGDCERSSGESNYAGFKN